MLILVTGACGAIGARLVAELVAAGHDVRGLVLAGDPWISRLDGVPCDVRAGDVTRPETLAGICDGVDAVLHLAAVVLSPDSARFRSVNMEGTRNLAREAQRAGVQHFVLVSSASVIYARSTPYSRSKRQAERIVREELPGRWTIVRPTLVYDEAGGEELLIFARHLERWPVVPLPGDGVARKRPVWARDLVRGLAAIAGNPRTLGRTYALAGGEAVTVRELAEAVLAARGKRRWLVSLPLPICRLGAVVARRLALPGSSLLQHAVAGLSQDADLDSSPAVCDLGYNPVGVRAGLARCWAAADPAAR